MAKLVECIPNFSVSREKDEAVFQGLVDTANAVPGCTLFDVYTGHHIAEGKKSVAFSLTMRADDQTLTDEHAEETVKKVLQLLQERFGAVMR